MYLQQPTPEHSHYPSLALSGKNTYQIQGDRVVITASTIANNRDAGNISGTLSIELWALNQPYQGGAFTGTVLAGTQIGEILDQHYLQDCRYDLLFNEPAAGSWHLTLMLREWTGNGFVTRDYFNFSQPYVASRKPNAVQGKAENVISVNFPGKEELPKEATKAIEVAEQPKPATKASTADAKMSINSASLHELAKIKGMSMKLAKAIVESRPFTTIEDILNVKGFGPKMLDKLRKFIQL